MVVVSHSVRREAGKREEGRAGVCAGPLPPRAAAPHALRLAAQHFLGIFFIPLPRTSDRRLASHTTHFLFSYAIRLQILSPMSVACVHCYGEGAGRVILLL